MEDLAQKITPKTRLVAVGYASYAVGTINPIERIVAISDKDWITDATKPAMEIVREGKSYKTITDPGGLYGFAGLCAGEYVMTLTPAGAGAIKNPNRVKLDGAASVKVDLPYR